MLRNIFLGISLCLITASFSYAENYSNNRAPLLVKPYVELPIGAIRAKGWLQVMLENQRSGASGKLDELYPLVMGPRNGWLGGDGDQWERGPYWIDGLLPLAYLLDDQDLKKKVEPWIEWSLKSQREDGFFGPATDYKNQPGLQRNNSKDWWPRMVMLKIMQQHYSATADQRVVDFMTKYFRYQLATLPTVPLDNWTHWAAYRACDNLQAVYWLYNITGDRFLLDLGEILHKQSYDYVNMFLNTKDLTKQETIHAVNLAQGIKEPVIYYQQNPDQQYVDAVKKAFADIKQYHGQAQGMYGGDECLHGANPTQGIELCSIVELMYSLEKMIEITGDLSMVDHLERIAFNALPAQATDDFMYHQYYQQANQVKVCRQRHNFDQDHAGTALQFGVLAGYPCCTSNQHQGWPKFTQNLWYATADNGIAALMFSPSEVTAKVGDGVEVCITEQTHYPMDNVIKFVVNTKDRKVKSVKFPFHVRIPSWTKGATVALNGVNVVTTDGGKIEVIDREWRSGDVLELTFPMSITTQRWYESSVAVERGPLVYALKMNANWSKLAFTGDQRETRGEFAFEVTSDDPWNYGLVGMNGDISDKLFTLKIDEQKLKSTYPWNLENAPIEISVKAKRIPYWQMYNNAAGPLPYRPNGGGLPSVPQEEITLVPYGCTVLRVTEFPVLR